MKNKSFILFFVCLIFCQVSVAQDKNSVLSSMGFENVRSFVNNDTLFATFDDPVYRGTFRGVSKAIMDVAKSDSTIRCFEIVLKEDNVSKAAVHVSKDDGQWNVSVDYDSKAIIRRLESENDGSRHTKMQNRSYGKVNLTFYPIISLDNHLTSKLFSYSIMIAPALETSLWKGNHIVVQPIIPICNNFESSNSYFEHWENKFVQLGSVNIQQDFIDNAKVWVKSGAGTFHYNYLGAFVDCGVHVGRYFDLGLMANITRYQAFSVRAPNIERNSDGKIKVHESALLKASYYEPHTSLELKLTAGRFVYGDLGARLDCTCHFGEYIIGAYGMICDGEHNAGFNFSVPMGPKRQKRMGYFSVRIPESFDWEYSVVSAFDWSDKNCGREIEYKGGKDKAAHYWQAKYLESYINKCLNGEVK